MGIKKYILAALVSCIAVATVSSAYADDNADANELVVKAVLLLKQAEAEDDVITRWELVTEAENNLNEVIEKYPRSDVAVKLITGQSIGTLSMEDVSRLRSEVGEKAVFALTHIGLAEAENTANFARAVRIAEGISHPIFRDAAFRTISVAFSLTDNFEEGIRAAESISDAGERGWALSSISRVLAGTGKFEEAIRVAESISDADWRLSTLRRIAEVQNSTQ